jgi:hypothetical protein
VALSEADARRVEETVERMIAEYRAKPTQEKEDGLGVEVANLPPAEREHVTAVLLAIVAADLRARTPRGGPSSALE